MNVGPDKKVVVNIKFQILLSYGKLNITPKFQRYLGNCCFNGNGALIILVALLAVSIFS